MADYGQWLTPLFDPWEHPDWPDVPSRALVVRQLEACIELSPDIWVRILEALAHDLFMSYQWVTYRSLSRTCVRSTPARVGYERWLMMGETEEYPRYEIEIRVWHVWHHSGGLDDNGGLDDSGGPWWDGRCLYPVRRLVLGPWGSRW